MHPRITFPSRLLSKQTKRKEKENAPPLPILRLLYPSDTPCLPTIDSPMYPPHIFVQLVPLFFLLTLAFMCMMTLLLRAECCLYGCTLEAARPPPDGINTKPDTLTIKATKLPKK